MTSSQRSPAGSFWPSELQRQLLVCALAEPDEAIACWRGLLPGFDLDGIEPGSFELMSLIYKNLTAGGHEDSLLPRLKGIYRRSWVANNLLLERTKRTAEALEAADVRALFIEGATLADRYYPELGLRPSSFVHVLVDEGAVPAALARLPQAGWVAPPGTEPGPAGERHFFDSEGGVCLLATSIAYDFVSPLDPRGASASLWDAAELQAIGAASVRVPCPTDALLATCVFGARRRETRTIQWIADAAMILGSHEIDWQRLVEVGATHGQALRLRDAFRYLSGLPVPRPPNDLYRRLAETRATARERLAHACAAGSIRGLGSLPDIVAVHLAATVGEPPSRVVASFPSRLRERWNLERNSQLPLAAGRRAMRLLARDPK